MKLLRVKDDLSSCLGVFDGSATKAMLTKSAGTGACPLTDMVRLQSHAMSYRPPVQSRCILSAAIALWEREAVRKAADAHLSSPVVRIEHSGIFACRNVRGSQTRRSQHAQANAIDIAAFVLQDGRRITVLRDWGKPDEEGRFLENLRDRSCRIFSGVLGPDYNAAHADHFHLDIGPYRICR